MADYTTADLMKMADVPPPSEGAPAPPAGAYSTADLIKATHGVEAEKNDGGMNVPIPKAAPPVPTGIMRNMSAEVGNKTADLLGAPADAGAALIRPTRWVELPADKKEAYRKENPNESAVLDFLEKASTHPTLGSDFFKDMMGKGSEAISGSKTGNPDATVAVTPGEKVARAATGGAVDMATMGLGAEGMLARGAKGVSGVMEGIPSLNESISDGLRVADAVLARTGAVGAPVGQGALDVLKGGGTAANTAIGATAGAGSEIAQENAPDALKPTAALLGGLGGGLVGGGVAAGVEGAGTAARGAYRAIAEPANLRAARTIEGAAQNPDQFRGDLQAAAAKPDEVAGAPLTTFQSTGDKGVGGLESELQQRYRAEFTDRKEQQNTARIAAITENTAPEAASADVTKFVKDKLTEIEAEHGVLVEQAQRDAAEKLAASGGTEHGTPSGYGADLQKRIDELDDIRHQKESALWALVDKDKDLKINPTPLRNAAIADEKAMPRTAEPIEGKELGILRTAQNLAPDTTFDELTTLRSRITDEIRNARKAGQGQTARRLTGLLGHVDDTLAGTMGDVAADPAQRSDLIKELLAVNEKWQAQRDEVAGVLNKRTGTGPLAGEGDDGLGIAGEGRISPIPGEGGQTAGQTGMAAGGEGVQTPLDGVPPEVAARYADARGATKDRKTDFGGAVGAAIAPGSQYGSFRATATAVANGLIDKPERFNAFIKAANGDPQAMSTIQDLAAFSMRKAAVKDGMISPQKLDQWVASHKHVFDEYPELQAKFADAKTARDTLDTSLANQQEALEAHQTSAARHFLGDKDPASAVGQAIKSPDEFGKLVDMVKVDPAALSGLKRAVGEFIAKKLIGNMEVGTSGENGLRGGEFQKFLKENKASLGKLFTPEEMNNFNNVAFNFKAAQRSDNALRVGGGSDTTQKMGAMMSTALKQFIAKHGATVTATAAGLEAARHSGGMTGLALAAGGAASGAITDALITSRVNTIEKAVVAQLLDRKLAAEWNAKIPKDNVEGFADSFGRKMRALTANQVTNAIEQEKDRASQ